MYVSKICIYEKKKMINRKQILITEYLSSWWKYNIWMSHAISWIYTVTIGALPQFIFISSYFFGL